MNPNTIGCCGHTIKVASGSYVDLLDPQPHMIDLRTIAAALSKTCRYGGHCPSFYSVAEHCVHAVRLAAEDNRPGDELRAIFLHDAAEAYVGDLIKPMKRLLPEFYQIEQRFAAVIEIAFGVHFDRYESNILFYDCVMLRAEKLQMWPHDTQEWPGLENYPDRRVKFQFLSPARGEQLFLETARALSLVCY